MILLSISYVLFVNSQTPSPGMVGFSRRKVDGNDGNLFLHMK